jgi:hypothetical protein
MVCRASEPIQPHTRYDINLSFPRRRDHGVERRPAFLGTGNTMVDMLDRVPPPGRSECSEGRELIFWRLLRR